ncbi:MAG: hypothetical protein HY670_04295 [Chloroflexi bacterium]|nr:hypothetical protein [Chloroflexota bacterium]
MSDTYVGLTIRKEVLRKDSVNIDLETLKEVALEAMQYYCQHAGQDCPDVEIQRTLPERLGIEEYRVNPDLPFKVRLSLEAENYAPFNSWMEVDEPDSREWAFITDLAIHLSGKFPELTFNANSSFFHTPNCDEGEKYTSLFKNGALLARLTRQEWVEKYLGGHYPQRLVKET